MILKNTRIIQSILIWFKIILEILNNYYSISIKVRLGIIMLLGYYYKIIYRYCVKPAHNVKLFVATSH